MKILFLGDYSGLHGCLHRELRRRGYSVTLVSDGCGYMRTGSDVALVRNTGLPGAVGYVGRILANMPRWRGYDVVQLSSTIFFSLRPSRIRAIFDWLIRHNRAVCLTSMSLDACLVKNLDSGGLFRYSEFRIGSELSPLQKACPGLVGEWTTDEMMSHCEYIYSKVDAVMPVLYEYWVNARYCNTAKVFYTGIPIDFSTLPPVHEPERGGRLKLFLGRKTDYMLHKGTDMLLEAARKVVADYPDKCELELAENMSLDEYLRRLAGSDIVLDQIYSYTPATNALQAMAMGKVAVSGGEPEYYRFIGEDSLLPVVNVTPHYDDIVSALSGLVADRQHVAALGAMGPAFVKKHNEVGLVADRFVNAWNEILGGK